ncbi:hypothetical protein NKR23_g5437 [Pleurostoma richardsiae]|uniref:Hydrophobin n=1 Tax=Pleurostoma richardsiae TaxID=41990 RepID=A0AA38VU09_9PEZI|nr:hypothetical protein NKR23_g5437 [Pleurostoma richardsiae]
MFRVISLLSLLLCCIIVLASPTPEPDGITDLPVVGPLLDLLNNPPPELLKTTNPSPECAAVNNGELMCCRAAVAGDLQPIVWLAAAYGYYLNPNDVNGLDCDSNLDACPGIKMCCQVALLTPLVALWCQDYP